MTELDLSDNRLEQLDGTLKNGAARAHVLSLRNNLLSSINSSVIPDTVQSLDMRGNSLKKLPQDLVEELNLTSLWLSTNPFQCDCSDYSFRQWIDVHQDVIQDVRQVGCAVNTNKMPSWTPFLALEQKQLCPALFPEYAKYLLSVLGVVAAFLAFSAIYLHRKRQLKALLRMTGACSWVQCVAQEDANVVFDVFLSYSSKDAGWVHDHLLPRLEALGVSCCTYERNFKGGFLLQDIIRDAIACSRRTLLLITQNFVASEWCRLEFRLALQRAMEDNINRLVIVLMDDMVPGTLDDDLRLYVRAANHLRWGEPKFWDRLEHSLNKKQAKKKLITEGPNNATASDIA